MALKDYQRTTLAAHLQADAGKYGGPATDGLAWTSHLLLLLSAWKREPNTAPKRKVPKPFDQKAIIGLLPPAAAAKALDTPGLLEALESGDKERFRTFGLMAKRADLLTDVQAKALRDELDATIDDPDHPAEVDAAPPAVQELFGTGVALTRDDVNFALGRPHKTIKDSDGKIVIREHE